MKTLVCMLTLVVVTGCASVSYDTLGAAYDALDDPTLTEEERADTRKWIERFGRTVEQAEKHYRLRAACMREGNLAWVCLGRERYVPRDRPYTPEEIVSVYRFDRGLMCGCMKSEDAVRWATQ